MRERFKGRISHREDVDTYSVFNCGVSYWLKTVEYSISPQGKNLPNMEAYKMGNFTAYTLSNCIKFRKVYQSNNKRKLLMQNNTFPS